MGMEEAPLTIKDSIDGMMKLVSKPYSGTML